jgi:hypothetical protein
MLRPSLVLCLLLLISQPHFDGVLFRAFQGFARKPLVSIRNFLPSKYLGFRFPVPSKKTEIYAVGSLTCPELPCHNHGKPAQVSEL